MAWSNIPRSYSYIDMAKQKQLYIAMTVDHINNPTPHYKESRLLEDMVDFRTGAGKVQGKPGTSSCAISKSQEPIWRHSPWPNL